MTRPLRIASTLALLSPAALLAACQPPAAKRDGAPAADLVADGPERAAPQPAGPPRSAVVNGGQPPTGRPCRVYLRRDAMGQSGMSPMPLNAASPAARAVQLEGTLESATERWVVVRSSGQTYWLPTGVVLAIEYAETR